MMMKMIIIKYEGGKEVGESRLSRVTLISGLIATIVGENLLPPNVFISTIYFLKISWLYDTFTP
jgi:hypothetical protein